ncbi:MAG: ubiquinol-cytochrome c reductase iron-sulfur subunit [Mycolicibacterium sp.]|uniref:QcrA and Rieske domain-containing protein n=1 Tax=Mycolicibacterium sp. TaxID=2320850 RepID=UPI003D0A88F2
MNINEVQRRTVIAGLGGLAGSAVAACSVGGRRSGSDSAAGSGSGSGSEAAPEILTKTADVPVGSGVVVGTLVVTQPVAGDFKAFSAVCTHTGCLINEVADGTINCPCHGSKFSLDGNVVRGPANRPLNAEAIIVQGDSIVLG